MISRFWRWLFPSESVSIATPLSATEVAALLTSRLEPPRLLRSPRQWFRPTLLGRVTPPRIWVRFERFEWGTLLAQEFLGRVEECPSGAVIAGKISSPRAGRAWMALWFTAMVLMGSAAFAILASGGALGEAWPYLLLWLGVVALTLVLTRWSAVRSEPLAGVLRELLEEVTRGRTS